MSNDPLRIFELGFSGDNTDKEARKLIDAWRDEWHLEPEPEMDGANTAIYESLIAHVSAAANDAAAQMRDLCAAKVRGLPAHTIMRTTAEEIRGAESFKSDVLHEFQSLTLEGEQEKQP